MSTLKELNNESYNIAYECLKNAPKDQKNIYYQFLENHNCKKHQNENLNLVCLDCENIICCICSTKDHKSHDVQHFSEHFSYI